MRKLKAIISVHDVMPATLDHVERLLSGLLNDVPPPSVSLLVVPGLEWTEVQVGRLKKLQDQGYEIAGHGWFHEVRSVSTLYHYLHSLFISRRAAEHLSLSPKQIERLLEENHQWFIKHGFQPPALYVPPAWAMGKISRQALRQLSFVAYESTFGIWDVASGRFKRTPLVGFEADTKLRAFTLRVWNRFNCWCAKAFGPVRVSIHPYDEQYLIAAQMAEIIGQVEAVAWHSLFDRPASS